MNVSGILLITTRDRLLFFLTQFVDLSFVDNYVIYLEILCHLP
jgi:hypothetical protein